MVAPLKSGAALLTPSDLSPTQQAAITAIYERDYTLLIGDTGFGKTPVCLTAAAELLDEGAINRLLVIAPAKVVPGWAREAAKWSHLAGLRIAAGTGQKAVAEAVASDAQVIVTSYESVELVLKSRHGCDAIVYDEITRAKTPGSKVVRLFRRWLKTGEPVWRVGLSATPLSESWLSAYAICLMLDKGERFGTNYDRFLKAYFTPVDFDQHIWEPRGKDAVAEMAEKVATLSYIVDQAEKRRQLPPVSVERVRTEYPSEELCEAQADMARHSLVELGGGTIAAKNRAVVSGKLRQLAQGFVMNEAGEPVWLDRSRVRFVADLARSIATQGRPVIIAYEFVPVGDALLDALGGFVDRIDGRTSKGEFEDIMARWRGRVDDDAILLLQQRAGAHGLDGLQNSCADLVLFAPLWSRDATLQLLGRIDRTGQTRPVTVREVEVPDTIDALVYDRVDTKAGVFRAFLEQAAKG